MIAKEIIVRKEYLDHIVSSLDRGMMIFLVGQRRVGKSYMLLQLKEWLEANLPTANVLYIDKESLGSTQLADADSLYEYVDKQLPEDGQNYLLIDEVQDVDQFENALRRLYAQQRCQIVATGSNAKIFSSELSTKVAGRYIEINIYSLTYLEFLEFHRLKDNDESLMKYLTVGGLPGLSLFGIEDERHIRDYMQGVVNTVMMKDVIERHKVRNIPFINNLIRFIADNIGKQISIKNIANFLKSSLGKEAASEITISAYISYLCSALVMSQVYRFDLHGKQLLDQNYKYYFADHGLRNYLCNFDLRGSIEKIIENVIWHHLLVQGFEVSVGQLKAGEIDFVAQRGDKRIYIQATYLLASEETMQREFGNLEAIHDNYPKYVVSMDPVSGPLSQYPGIIHLRLRDFLKLQL